MESFISELIDDCKSKVHFARQICGQDDSVLHDVADQIQEKINRLPKDVRTVRADLKQYASFADFVFAVLTHLYDDRKFDRSDTITNRKTIKKANKKENREEELFFHLYSVLKEDFARKNIFVLLIVEHYEAAKELWTDGNCFASMRELAVESPKTSYLFLTDRPVSEVSDEPVGSSPLSNVFDFPIRVGETNER